MRKMETEVRVEAKNPEQGQMSKLIWMIWFVFGATLFSINIVGGLTNEAESSDQYEYISYGMD